MNRSTIIIFLTLSALLLLPFTVLGEEIPEFVESITTHIQNENFDQLSSLYLLPDHYSEAELIEEKKGIKNALELLSNEFGAITTIELNQDEVRWFNLEIFGGDVDFIKNQPNFYQYVFRANFEKLGNGFIIIRTYPTSSDSKLRSVGYALPEAEENIPIIKSIGEKLTEQMFPEKTSTKI